MRLNTSTDYAILTLMHLAASGKVVSSAELASNISVSKRYLAQIASKLRKGGFIGVSMGSTGGYYLTKSPDEISIYDIVSLMEGSLEILRYTKTNVKNHDVLYEAYAELESHINGYMQIMTLDVLTKKSKTEWRELVSNMAIQYAKECSDNAP
jgi:Rrf2 family protein